MALQLHCKRSKLFMRHNGKTQEKVTCARGEVTKVPDWVKDQPGYAAGIKDKSIVDLTPPKMVPVPTPVIEEENSEVTPQSGEPEDTPTPVDDGDGGDDSQPSDEEKKPIKKARGPKGLQAR